jgi:hypothetical protein
MRSAVPMYIFTITGGVSCHRAPGDRPFPALRVVRCCLKPYPRCSCREPVVSLLQVAENPPCYDNTQKI